MPSRENNSIHKCIHIRSVCYPHLRTAMRSLKRGWKGIYKDTLLIQTAIRHLPTAEVEPQWKSAHAPWGVRKMPGWWLGRSFQWNFIENQPGRNFINKCLSTFCLNFNVRKKFRWTFKNVSYYLKWPVLLHSMLRNQIFFKVKKNPITFTCFSNSFLSPITESEALLDHFLYFLNRFMTLLHGCSDKRRMYFITEQNHVIN